MLPSGMLAYFMSENFSPRSCRHVARWKNFTKNNLELQWPVWGTFQLDKVVHLRSVLESKTSQMKQTERDACFNWCAEASS